MAIGMLLGVKMFPSLGHIYSRSVLDSLAKRQDVQKIEEALRYIQARYVDTMSMGTLTDEALEAMVDQLDPHSAYFQRRDVRGEELEREGHYEGIGVEFTILQDTAYLHKIIPGSPADRAGLKPGDAILSIDTNIISGRQRAYADILRIIPDHPSTEFPITYLPLAAKTPVTMRIKKEIVHFPTVTVAAMLSDEVGVIKLARFNQTSYREFMESLEILQKENVKDLIIDLRGNPGGYLQQAVQILSQLFTEKGIMLVYTAGRHGRTEYKSTGRPFFNLRKIAVLIDEYSASASEIVAGAVQDLDRGVVIGRRSFGKGLVQKQFSLSDGSALLLTVEKYYTPSGRAIQRSYADHTRYLYEVYHRLEDGELTGEAAIPVVDSSKYFTSKGRVVYGGGGITPDVFIPLNAWSGDSVIQQSLNHLDEYVLATYIQSDHQKVNLPAFVDYLQAHHGLHLSVEDGLLRTYLERRLANAWVGLKQDQKQRLILEMREDPAVETALKSMKGLLSQEN